MAFFQKLGKIKSWQSYSGPRYREKSSKFRIDLKPFLPSNATQAGPTHPEEVTRETSRSIYPREADEAGSRTAAAGGRTRPPGRDPTRQLATALGASANPQSLWKGSSQSVPS